jgi:hypothetical protein
MNEENVAKRILNSLKREKFGKELKVVKNSCLRPIKPNNIEIDICFKNRKNELIGIEVKGEEVTRDEIRKGVGQALEYLEYCHRSFLAIPAKYQDDVEKTFGKYSCRIDNIY